MHSHHGACATVLPEAQSNRAKQPWTETSETASRDTPFHLRSSLPQVLYPSNGKLTNTIGMNFQGLNIAYFKVLRLLSIITLLLTIPMCWGFYDYVYVTTNARTRNQMLMMLFTSIRGVLCLSKSKQKIFLPTHENALLGQYFWKGLDSFQIPK